MSSRTVQESIHIFRAEGHEAVIRAYNAVDAAARRANGGGRPAGALPPSGAGAATAGGGVFGPSGGPPPGLNLGGAGGGFGGVAGGGIGGLGGVAGGLGGVAGGLGGGLAGVAEGRIAGHLAAIDRDFAQARQRAGQRLGGGGGGYGGPPGLPMLTAGGEGPRRGGALSSPFVEYIDPPYRVMGDDGRPGWQAPRTAGSSAPQAQMQDPFRAFNTAAMPLAMMGLGLTFGGMQLAQFNQTALQANRAFNAFDPERAGIDLDRQRALAGLGRQAEGVQRNVDRFATGALDLAERAGLGGVVAGASAGIQGLGAAANLGSIGVGLAALTTTLTRQIPATLANVAALQANTAALAASRGAGAATTAVTSATAAGAGAAGAGAAAAGAGAAGMAGAAAGGGASLASRIGSVLGGVARFSGPLIAGAFGAWGIGQLYQNNQVGNEGPFGADNQRQMEEIYRRSGLLDRMQRGPRTADPATGLGPFQGPPMPSPEDFTAETVRQRTMAASRAPGFDEFTRGQQIDAQRPPEVAAWEQFEQQRAQGRLAYAQGNRQIADAERAMGIASRRFDEDQQWQRDRFEIQMGRERTQIDTGYGRQVRDIGIQTGRGLRDIGLQEQDQYADLATSSGYARADVGRNLGRSYRDIDINAGRSREDIERNYARSGEDIVLGMVGGLAGAFLGREVARSRAYEDLGIGTGRAREDAGRGAGDAYADIDENERRSRDAIGLGAYRARRGLTNSTFDAYEDAERGYQDSVDDWRQRREWGGADMETDQQRQRDRFIEDQQEQARILKATKDQLDAAFAMSQSANQTVSNITSMLNTHAQQIAALTAENKKATESIKTIPAAVRDMIANGLAP